MKKNLLRLGTLCLMLLVGMMLQAATVIANWSWKEGIPATIASAHIEGTTGTVASDVEGIVLTVDATSGKLKANGDNAQMNAGTKIQVPVQSAKDVVTVVAHPYNFKSIHVGGVASTDQTTVHTATASEVKKGYVEVEATEGMYLYAIKVVQTITEKLKADRLCSWDFKNDVPAGIQAATNYQNTVADIPSDVDGVMMHVDATNGKLYCIGRNNAQFITGTVLRVPVLGPKDIVTVTGYPGYCSFTVGGTAVGDGTNNVVEYKAKAADVAKGYVEIASTDNNCYLYGVTVLQKSAYEEKALYSTTFTDWTDAGAAKAESVVTKNTKYSNETLNFTLFDTQISSTNKNATKFPTWEGGYLMASKTDATYIVTSPLKSITRVHFMHGATGGNRGYKLECKGDGDADWVVLSDAVANPASGQEVNVTVNRTNCQLRFTNLNATQNAYLFQLDIWGEVETASSPALGSFKVNGQEYVASDIFAQDDNQNMVATIEISKKATVVSAENPLTDVTAENGELGEITYQVAADKTTTVTMPVTLGDATTQYILTVVQKPDFTLTYFDADGTTQLGTQTIEKDAQIEQFAYGAENVTVTEGKVFRGWSVSTAENKQKYAVTDAVVDNANLYALVTEEEVASATARYDYPLNNKYFYAEDHEAFHPEGNGAFHDAQHGWVFSASDQVKLVMGGKGYIKMNLCQYGSGVITLTDPDGNVVATTNAKVSPDGASAIFNNTSDKAGEYTLSFTGTTYIHALSIVNMQETPYAQNGNWYTVKAGDAKSFITTLEIVTGKNATAGAERAYIFLPDGTYDLGNKCLTNVSGNNISIIGQSMDKTIIMNTPEQEGIGVTATLLNTSNDLYLQDLTLKNAYPFDASTGRAVCLQDRGTRTIAKNVRLLSYQDTYYSNNNNGKFYWETSDLHGTVDYLCGGGDVYYKNCTLTNEAEKKDVTMTAPYTDGTNYGYVFDGCKIVMVGDRKFNFGRSWGGTAKCLFMNTVLTDAAKNALISTRWTPGGMNVIAKNFYEYNTLDEAGNVISPAENVVAFKLDKQVNEYNTIMNAETAKNYTLDKVFPTWMPGEKTVQAIAPVVVAEGNTLSWPAVDGAIQYAVFKDGKFVTLTSEPSYISEGEGNFTVRAANAMGGFGEESSVVTDITKLNGESVSVTSVTIYSLNGQKQAKLQRGVNIMVKKMADGTTKTQKVIVK